MVHPFRFARASTSCVTDVRQSTTVPNTSKTSAFTDPAARSSTSLGDGEVHYPSRAAAAMSAAIAQYTCNAASAANTMASASETR